MAATRHAAGAGLRGALRLLSVACLASVQFCVCERTIKVSSSYYVFLQRFELANVVSSSSSSRKSSSSKASLVDTSTNDRIEDLSAAFLFHSEVVLCPDNEFNEAYKSKLDGYIEEFENLPEDKRWKELLRGKETEATRAWPSAACQGLTFTINSNPTPHNCTGISQGDLEFQMRKSLITDVKPDTVVKYLYGKTDDSLDALIAKMCVKGSCATEWDFEKYSTFLRNCNHFANWVLRCGLQLSSGMPYLGASKLGSGYTDCTCIAASGATGH